jgi:hypothetical protein
MSAELNKGGPAFPVTAVNHTDKSIKGCYGDEIPPNSAAHYFGMTLRDYFAAKAMQGECAAMWGGNSEWGGLSLDIGDKLLNRRAAHWYRIADAMLRARDA